MQLRLNRPAIVAGKHYPAGAEVTASDAAARVLLLGGGAVAIEAPKPAEEITRIEETPNRMVEGALTRTEAEAPKPSRSRSRTRK